MKKELISLCLLSFILTFSACSSKDINITASNDTMDVSVSKKKLNSRALNISSENIETIATDVNMSERYVSFNNLLADAEIIIEGEVLDDISYFDFNTIPRTKSHVKVTKSYNNNSKVGDILTFIESGGITTKDKIIEYSGEKEKFGTISNEEDKKTKVKYLVGGSETMKSKEKVLIFAVQDKSNFYKLPEKYYISLGAFMGKFNINQNKIKRFMPNKTKKDIDFDLIENIDDYRKELEKRLKSK